VKKNLQQWISHTVHTAWAAQEQLLLVDTQTFKQAYETRIHRMGKYAGADDIVLFPCICFILNIP
jgi:hypothetical protein